MEKLYKDYLSEKIAKEGNQKYAEILHDKDKLNKYIDELNNKQTNVLEGSLFLPNPIINPIYGEYIKRWGVPDNYIFDPALLDEIKVKFKK